MALPNTNRPELITLRENNPYSVGSVFLFKEGDIQLEREEINPPKTIRDRYYTVEASDDMWSIAFKAYGNSKWWWVIRDANKIDFGFDLEFGKTLIIPDLNTVKVNS